MSKVSTCDGNTLRIRVVPDEKSPIPTPLVLLTEREPKAGAAPIRIVWRKLSASKKFKMVSLEDLVAPPGSVFQNIVVSDKKIECDFVPLPADPPGTEYEYRLTIFYKGTEYNTDKRGSPIGGRAVIRN